MIAVLITSGVLLLALIALRYPLQGEALKAGLREIMDLTVLAESTHVMEYVNSMHEKLHDLDCFLLRYGPVDVSAFVSGDSIASKYCGTRSIYR